MTYFVSTTGSDSNPGTQAAPWRLLQWAGEHAKPDDVVTVLAGDYKGMDLNGLAYGGSAGHPITFIAQPGVNVTSMSTVHNQYAQINLEGTKGYFVIDGFKVSGGGAAQKAGIRVAGSPGCIVRNNEVSGAFTGIFASQANGIVVENNRCHDNTSQHGIYVNGTDGYTIRGNECWGNAWDGIHTNVADGVNTINTNGLVEGNKVHGNNLSGFDITGAAFCKFLRNLSYGNGKHGFVLQNTNQNPTPACHDNTLEYNTLVGDRAIHVDADNSLRTTVRSNVLVGFTTPIDTPNQATMSGNVTGSSTSIFRSATDFHLAASDTAGVYAGDVPPPPPPPPPVAVDSISIEVAMRFQSSVAGTVTALRLYRGVGDYDAKTVQFLNAGGTVLFSAPIPAVTVSGWQEIACARPIKANTVYGVRAMIPRSVYVSDLRVFGMKWLDMVFKPA